MDILNKLKIPYRNIDLYEQAFTHTSFANEKRIESYERLEYLGDAVLELIVSEYLYKNTNYEEGKMTKLRSHYVCENALYEYSLRLGLNEYIKLGKGQLEQDGAIEVSFKKITIDSGLVCQEFTGVFQATGLKFKNLVYFVYGGIPWNTDL